MMISRLLPAIVLTFGLVAAACGDEAGPASSDGPDVTLPPPNGSIDGAWLLGSGAVDGVPVDLVDGWDVTMSITGDRIGGTAACNGYGGSVDLSNGGFGVTDLSWTEMGCEPAVMDLEQAFLRSLTEITSYDLVEDVLTLSGPAAEWVFAADAPVPDSEIVGTTWVLDTYIDGDTATSSSMMELATLTLHADGTLTGSTSCRRLDGEWVTTGATLQITSFSAIDDPAAGACVPDAQMLDGQIISVLESGVGIEIDGNRLTLMAPGNEGLSYTSG